MAKNGGNPNLPKYSGVQKSQGTPVKKPTNFYKNLTNVKGQVSGRKPRRAVKKFNQSAYTRVHKSVFGL